MSPPTHTYTGQRSLQVFQPWVSSDPVANLEPFDSAQCWENKYPGHPANEEPSRVGQEGAN